MRLLRSDNLPYKNPDRLADVLALIQVLALDAYRHRSESGLIEELQAGPRSAAKWEDIARMHPEFFRFEEGNKLPVSLVATHVLPKNENNKRELPPGFLALLLQTAITLHDRQMERAYLWKMYLPILGSIIGLLGVFIAGVFTVLGILLKSWLG